MYTHRPLEGTDAEIICDFAKSAEEQFFAFPDAGQSLTPETFIRFDKQGQSSIVALSNDVVVGYVNVVHTEAKGFCTIGHLMVHPDHRRKGVARYLIGVVTRIAFETYCARFVRAICISHNQPAYQLFHSLGFKPGEMKHQLGVDGAPVLMINLYLHRRKISCDD